MFHVCEVTKVHAQYSILHAQRPWSQKNSQSTAKRTIFSEALLLFRRERILSSYVPYHVRDAQNTLDSQATDVVNGLSHLSLWQMSRVLTCRYPFYIRRIFCIRHVHIRPHVPSTVFDVQRHKKAIFSGNVLSKWTNFSVVGKNNQVKSPRLWLLRKFRPFAESWLHQKSSLMIGRW